MVKKIYKTMQGREIDMESLMSKNETIPAVGNAKMNARGDTLGAGGKIIKTREQATAEYYDSNPAAQPRGTPIAKEQAAAPVVKEQAAKKPITKKEGKSE